MASIPSNGYAEVMSGTNNYTGSNSFDGSCPRTAIAPVIGNDLCNKTYVDATTGGALTDKGSLLTANGTNAVIFDENPYQTALTTTTVYDWNSLAIGQSRNFTTTFPTFIPLGARITITYSGTDSIKGNVTAVAGTTITLTITALASIGYSSTVLLNSTGGGGLAGFDTTGPGNTNLFINPVIFPGGTTINQNTIITSGDCDLYINTFADTFSITISGTNVVRGKSSIQALPSGPPSYPTTSIFWSGANGGCFIGSTQTPVLNVTDNTTGFEFPLIIGGSLGGNPIDFTGNISGYTVAYSTGSIVIDDDIALIADASSSNGLAWGVISSVVGSTTTSGLVLTGDAALLSGTAGGNSGQHLVVVVNGATYKIKLELP